MAKYTIVHRRDECIGCGSCVAVCPGNWVMTTDGKADPIRAEDDLECNKEAASICPVQCIDVKENTATSKPKKSSKN